MTTSHSTENPQIDPMPTKNGDRMEIEWSKKLSGRKRIANEKEAHCQREGSAPRLRWVAVILLMIGWGMTAMGQDYSGYYFIANNKTNAFNSTDPTANWYMVPASNCGYPSLSPTAWQYNNSADTPLVTTFQTQKDNNSIWHIVKSGDYYYIIHNASGKYLTYNEPEISTNYRAFHLESVSNLDDEHLFSITSNGDFCNINPKNLTSGSCFVNPLEGNKPCFYGQEKNSNAVAGLLGLNKYAADDGSKWVLEPVCPVISYNASDKVEITYAPDATASIYYTIDGSTPTTSSTPYTEAFDPADDVISIKAIAVSSGVESSMAIFNIIVPLGSNHPRMVQSRNNVWNESEYSFYMLPGEANPGTVNTSSLLRPSMEWYFKYAENEGVPYYYIVNKDSDKYMCYTYSNNTHYVNVENYNENNASRFKFRIQQNNSSGNYNIIPYDLWSGNVYIYKNTDNSSNKSLTLGGVNNNSSWRFVRKTDVDDTPPFTISNETNIKFYQIFCTISNTNYYLVPPITGNNATTITIDQESDRMSWKLVKAADPSNVDWLTYYYIINAVTNEYLYYTGPENEILNVAAFEMRNEIAAGNENRYMFAMARSATLDYWFIVPKSLKDVQVNNIASLWWNKSNLKIEATRNDVSAKWKFEERTITVATPEITFDNTDNKATITCSTVGATIHYTMDGTTPTSESTTYSIPLTLTTTTTIKAIAVMSGQTNSAMAMKEIVKISTPDIITDGQQITISSSTSGTVIRYTSDGTEPTINSTVYLSPLDFDTYEGKMLKAIAIKSGCITSDVSSLKVGGQCCRPVITKGDKTFTITCSYPTSDVIIYYTTDGSTPIVGIGTSTTSGAPVSFTDYGFTVKAFATAEGYDPSLMAEKYIQEGYDGSGTADNPYLISSQYEFGTFITDVNNNANGEASMHYRLTADVSGGDPITMTFSGSFDGGFHNITGLTHALFNSVSGGTVKNVFLKEVSIGSRGDNVGALAESLTGTSSAIGKIYNCGVLSGSVSGSQYVGGLVGVLGDPDHDDNCYARVINCYSYADITGGSFEAGIVGYNNYASKTSDIRTMVMNCMFYGDITGGNNIAPIYGGEKITNRGDLNGLNNYNYFLYDSITSTITTYNCALGVEKSSFLRRFEFYRNILNSNRELACWYATGSTTNARDVMAKWVLETADRNNTSPYPYPVLKENGRYPSIVNIDADHATATAERNKGGLLGTLAVHVQMDNTNDNSVPYHHPNNASVKSGMSDISLNITDKDDARYNYCYRKVQLPYYNDVGTNNYNDNRVVTGWKIVSMEGNSNNTFTANTTYPEGATDQNILGIDDCYNFADRTEVGKDLYGTSGRIFSQGAYFNVPDNVTSITIEPYWAKCTYLSDANFDVTYNTGSTAYNITAMGTRYSNNEEVDINGSSQKVYTSMSNALSNLGRDASHTVYDYAVVFVGNYHHYSSGNSYTGNNWANTNGNPSLPVTLMSADLDGDNEPDNVFILQHGKTRIGLCPIRYDFLCIPDLGLVQKADGLTRIPSIGAFWPYGWYEITNTCLIRISQMEYASTKQVVAPLILQGGVFDFVFTSFQGGETHGKNRTNYIHLGGNVYFNEFSNGSHINNTQYTAHVPISVTGGEFEKFYLSGMQLPTSGSPTVKADNAEGYIDGGKFSEVASGGMQKIDGNVKWIVFNADIENFYGGGINAVNPVTGNLSTTMRDSYVGTYCGGPKFGNMSSGKTVTSNITGGTFGTFFGAGYGGTSLSRQSTQQDNAFSDQSKWGTWADTYDRKYNASYGIASRYEFKYFQFSGGSDNTQVGQMYIYYASMSLAQTNNVTTTMNGSTVTGNFYGGGSLGKVSGNATSTLTGCTINGNAFGAGFSVTIPTVSVMNTGRPNPYPGFDSNAGVFTEAGYPESVTYTWKHANSVSAGNEFDDTGGHFILTTEDLTTLGTVSGNATLTIDGGSVGGNVFGGGDESAVNQTSGNEKGNTIVKLQGNTNILGNVYGGGNKGAVGGDSSVTIQDAP